MKRIYAFHGFLGLPLDWHRFALNITTPSLFEIARPQNLWQWGAQLNTKICRDQAPARIGIGYSLGGRLLLHALLDNPSLWKGGIIISAHLGLDNETERRARLSTDTLWAKRFEEEPWEQLMHAWEKRSVFQGSLPIAERREKDYSRKFLAEALRVWSLGTQEPLQQKLKQLSIPLLWIAGERDLPYASIARQASTLHPHARCWIAPGAGHRVPWENPKAFQEQVEQFLVATS